MTGPEIPNFYNQDVPPEERITYFGVTDSRNKRVPFGIKHEDRSRHTYVIGKTGMGKSTLLENMAAQDIIHSEGMCFIDPHGGSAEKLLDYIPENRIKDVLYFAPFDMEYPISFNVLENVDADKRHLVVAGLMSTFEKIWLDAWSARMAYILQNTLGALLEFPGATLLSVNRMYIDKEYRKNVISKITDPAVRSFWVDEYSKYTDRYAQEATPAIQNKIGQFASNALVRNVIGQPESSFNIRELMDKRKIFLVNLSKGRVGEGNANLLGSMLITKIYLAAMSRADTTSSDLRNTPPFYLFVDEFQNFANKSFADILSEARKYKLALTIAHQYIEQMAEEVRAAVFGNVGTMMTFRVGAYDADVLEKEFAPVFYADDLVNLGARQIYLKLMIDGVSSQPFSATTLPPVQAPQVNHRDRALAHSRSQYSRPRAEVEKDITEWVDMKYQDPEKDEKDKARLERRAQREKGETKDANERRVNVRDRRQHPPKRDQSKEKKEEYKKDLRSLLSQMTEENKKSETVDEDATEKPVSIQKVAVTQKDKKKTASAQQKFVPNKTKDTGKGITDEGREELRSLLAKLSPQKTTEKEFSKVDTQTEVQEKATPSKQEAQVQTVPEVKKVGEPKKTNNTKEIPKEEMENMLHVKKPNL
jgi:hypothetical protein